MPGFLVVGPGRAGRSFIGALGDAGWRLDGVIGRGDDPTRAAADTDVVLLTVPDDVIATVAAAVEPGRAVVVHTSGSRGLDVLAPHRRRASVHPLVSLPDPDTGADRLAAGGVFAVAGDPVAARIVADLGGRPVTVTDDQRDRYHAAAAVAANHLVVLCAQVERLAGPVGVPLDAYWDLMASTLDNVRRVGPVSSLTGPAARGDAATISRHLNALPPDEHHLYATLAAEAARLAGTTGDVTVNQTERTITATAPTPTVVTTIVGLRAELDRHRAAGRSVGFVPTMGYLHDGHASLMRRAAEDCDVAVASIFVNPLQFAPGEDLATYPRDLDHDLAVAAGAGVTVVFAPGVEEMYPDGEVMTTVTVGGISATLEGASRPSHFAGVATVVTKLLSIVGPCRAYFGEKDFQQLAIIRRMVADLSLAAEIVGCPIVREPDGLAMSSRNVRLLGADRRAATVLNRALIAGADAIAAGERDGAAVEAVMAAVVAAEPLAELDYAAAADPDTLARVGPVGSGTRLLIAARVGPTRLIDNRGVTTDPTRPMG